MIQQERAVISVFQAVTVNSPQDSWSWWTKGRRDLILSFIPMPGKQQRKLVMPNLLLFTHSSHTSAQQMCRGSLVLSIWTPCSLSTKLIKVLNMLTLFSWINFLIWIRSMQVSVLHLRTHLLLKGCNPTSSQSVCVIWMEQLIKMCIFFPLIN